MRTTTATGRTGQTDVLRKLEEVLASHPSRAALVEAVQALRRSSDHYSWVGIYLVRGERLVLEAFAGDAETEHVSIPIGEGICGSAAKTGETIVVPDVSKDSRYLMCFPSTRSEIVVPIIGRKGVMGEIDIDSDKLGAFDSADREILEKAATKLAAHLEKTPGAGKKGF